MTDLPDTVEWRCKVCGKVDRAATRADAELLLALHIKANHPKEADKRKKRGK